MARRDQVQRIDLTTSTDAREREPSRRAAGEDITARYRVRFLGVLSMDVSLKGHGRHATEAVIRFVVIGTAMVPPVIGLGACLAANVGPPKTLTVFLTLSALTLADAWHKLHRRQSARVRVDGAGHPSTKVRHPRVKTHPRTKAHPPAQHTKRRRHNRRRPRH